MVKKFKNGGKTAKIPSILVEVRRWGCGVCGLLAGSIWINDAIKNRPERSSAVKARGGGGALCHDHHVLDGLDALVKHALVPQDPLCLVL